MKVKQQIAVTTILASLLLSATSSPYAQMSTSGGFRVSESGAATYEIPITVPPGVAGMEPKLSLVYSSQGGNGLLGMGWSLSGLSSITRCPRTMAQDGVRGAINYDANDRFCMDGQRLIQISGGAYGAVGAEYRTEREGFSKISSAGGSSGNPDYFEVKTKAGVTMRYGFNADSRIEAQGKSPLVRVWAIDRMVDAKSNAMTVAYTEDYANGDFRPANVGYAGNYVTFGYAGRADMTPLYEAGSKYTTLYRISQIRTFTDSSKLIRDYQLTYAAAPSTNRSRLTSFKECMADSVTCFPPLTFTWQDGGHNIPTWPWSSQQIGTADGYQHYVADVNGDGKSDLVQIQRSGSNNLYVGISDGTGFTVWTPSWNSTSVGIVDSYQHYLADVNGDGLADLIQVNRGGNLAWIGLSTGNGFTVWSKSSSWVAAVNDYEHFFADVDGDGRADWIQVARATNNAYVALSGDDTFAQLFNTSTPAWSQSSTYVGGANGYQHYFADINGDGKADWIQVARATNNAYVGLSNGDGTFANLFNTSTPSWSFSSTNVGPVNDYEHHFSDVNGDGRADWIQVARATNNGYVGLSNGDGTFATLFNPSSPAWTWSSNNVGAASAYEHQFADINGDGKADWIQIRRDTANAGYIGLSNGDGSFPLWTWGSYQIGTVSGYAHYFGDVDGDGKADWIQIQRSSTNNGYLGISDGVIPDLMTTVTNGIGATATVVYKPLTNSKGTVYAKDNAGSYPTLNLQAPFYVAASSSSSNGVGGTASTNYFYTGLKAELGTGRGLLGFKQVDATDASTGVKGMTLYNQSWPYVGLPSQSKRTAPDGTTILSQTDFTYACTNPTSGTSCTVAAGNRYFPYASQTDETSRDLNNTFISKVRTTSTYDALGNATVIGVTHLDSGGSSLGYSKTTTNTYTNDTTNWLLGRLIQSQVQSTAP